MLILKTFPCLMLILTCIHVDEGLKCNIPGPDNSLLSLPNRLCLEVLFSVTITFVIVLRLESDTSVISSLS